MFKIAITANIVNPVYITVFMYVNFIEVGLIYSVIYIGKIKW